MRLFILSLLFCSLGNTYAQSPVPVKDINAFMKMPINMEETLANKYINKQWPQKEVKDTGPMQVYVIGTPDDDETLSGALRLLVYFMGGSLSNKEIRFSVNREQVRPTLDSLKNALVKEYGNPGIDSTITLPGFEGSIKVYSWSFPQLTDDKELYRVDLAAYKLKYRKDYTILAAVFTRRYQKMLPARNYLHY